MENISDIVPDVPLSTMPDFNNSNVWYYNSAGQAYYYQSNYESLSLCHYLQNYIAQLLL
jgi:hypothetical protein